MSTRVIGARLWVDWDFDGNYTDESAYLVSASGDMSLVPPGAGLMSSSGIISQMKLTLRNASGRFSPLRTDGALYAYIRDGKSYHAPVYLEVTIDGGSNYHRVFTGVLKLPKEGTPTTKDGPTVIVDARSMEERYLQQRASVYQSTFAGQHDLGYTESDYINTWLQTVGVSAGDITRDAGMFVVPLSLIHI